MQVTEPAVPALRLEVASGHRVLLRQQERVVLLVIHSAAARHEQTMASIERQIAAESGLSD